VTRKKTTQTSLPFKDILAGLMKERGLTLQQVADLAGVSKSVAQSWLSGSNPHDIRAVSKLGRSLGVGLSELLLGENDSQAAPGGLTLDPLDAFEEQPFVDGVFRVTLQRLVPRRSKK
jgi:transcriptional regulator with XRE-family HTH domain